MKVDKGTSMKCPDYTKDILDTVSCKRRSKTNGISIDKKKLTQNETLLLVGYTIVQDNEIYKKLITIDFPVELINRLSKKEQKKDV